MACDMHQPELSLDHDIIARPLRIGARLPVTRDRGIDKTGIDLMDGIKIHAVFLQGPREVILYEYITFCGQLV